MWEGSSKHKNLLTKKKKNGFVGLKWGGIRKVSSFEREYNFSVCMCVNRLNA